MRTGHEVTFYYIGRCRTSIDRFVAWHVAVATADESICNLHSINSQTKWIIISDH